MRNVFSPAFGRKVRELIFKMVTENPDLAHFGFTVKC
jgi:hypothetical protein